MSLRWMHFQTQVKDTIKPLLFADVYAPRRIKFGIGRGARLYFNRRKDLQRELGLYEKELESVYRRFIRNGAVVYDVGGADGCTAIILAGLAKGGMVVSFEPDSKAYESLLKNVSINPQVSPKIKVSRTFVGSSSDKGKTPPVDCIDEMVQCHTYPPPTFVKIDVEGEEINVLHGMVNVIREHKPVLVIETHSEELELACLDFFAQFETYHAKVVHNSKWRTLLPEYRLVAHNRWLLAVSIDEFARV